MDGETMANLEPPVSEHKWRKGDIILWNGISQGVVQRVIVHDAESVDFIMIGSKAIGLLRCSFWEVI